MSNYICDIRLSVVVANWVWDRRYGPMFTYLLTEVASHSGTKRLWNRWSSNSI